MDGEHKELGLPPRVGRTESSDLVWQSINGLNYELLGYFLSCHLIIEHYMDELLKRTYPELDWDAAKPSFGQRVALFGDMNLEDRYNPIPAIKHMNSVRNKISHRIDFEINSETLLPMKHYIQKIADGRGEVPTDPKELLDQFTMLACMIFAGRISQLASESTKRKARLALDS